MLAYMPVDRKLNDLFNAFVRFIIGNGEKVKFWLHPWINDLSLCASALDLFACCTRKNLFVVETLRDKHWIRHLQPHLPPRAILHNLPDFGVCGSAVAA